MFNQLVQPNESTAPTILYMGDTALDGAASYLAGVMARHGLPFDYVASDRSPTRDQLSSKRKLFIVSDFMARMLAEEAQQTILKEVEAGAGLLMIGGWESYSGLGGDWAETPLAAALPVEIASQDDRVNFDQVALLAKVMDHWILEGLPWDEHPPAIGGFNRFAARPGNQVLLNVIRHRVRRVGRRFVFEATDTDPLLVTAAYGQGRTAALATDLAPHWVGPLVDWGTDNHPPSCGGRVTAQAPGGNEVEVGSHYDRFVHRLLSWTGRFPIQNLES